jgi:hypothetical protein
MPLESERRKRFIFSNLKWRKFRKMSGKREKINSGLLEMFKTFPAFNYNICL